VCPFPDPLGGDPVKEDFKDYVEHPRYGRKPRTTSLNPKDEYPVVLSWRSTKHSRIPFTAVEANPQKQNKPTVPITHYFDEKRVCESCKRPFLFFAQEQKYWYEEIGFGLDSDCVRCHLCRKRQRGLRRLKMRTEELFHLPNRSIRENLEMADCYLRLVQAKVFSDQQLETVSRLLKQCRPHGQNLPKFKQVEDGLRAYRADKDV
jgi:hypothetical protein